MTKLDESNADPDENATDIDCIFKIHLSVAVSTLNSPNKAYRPST